MPEEIAVEIKPKENNLKIYLVWSAIIVGISLVAVTVGFTLGKSGQLPLPPKNGNTATESAVRNGWSELAGKDFSIQFPKDWQGKEHPTGEIAGARLTNPGGIVEFWLKVERPYQFLPEQKQVQTGKKEEKIEVDTRASTLTEFSYESGGSFLIVEVPATNNQSKVTFWATAADEVYKKTVLDIISSFKIKAGTF